MALQHTPGPWAYNADRGEVFKDDGDVEPRVSTVDMDNLCSFVEQGHADGRLIAAAPDLLAALRGFMGEYLTDEHTWPDAMVELLRAGRKAIAKAEG